MEARKNPEAELEGRKTTFWLLGMLLALGLTLVAFEWTAFERTVGEMAALEMDLLEEEVIPAIQQCLARVDELDERLLAQQELLHRCQLEAEREALGALRLQMA